MAVAIPLIMGATGASAAIGAAVGLSAATISIGTGLLLGATGVNAKIDKAASKVFGKDIVKLGNIAGMIYGAAGGFAGSSMSEVGANLGFGGAAAADATGQGALSSMGANPFDASQSLAMSGGLDAATAGFQAPPSVLDGAMVAGQGTLNGAVQMPTKTTGTGGVGSMWNKLGDKGQSALIQLGGNMLAGAAEGKAKEEEDRRYRSGSGRAWGGGALPTYNAHYIGGGT